MKKIFKVCIVLLGFTLAACLEDDKYALDPSGSENIIEFLDPTVPVNPSGAIYPVWSTTTEIAPSFTFQQTISYSGPNNNNKDIDLVVEVDPVALEEYNAQMEEELGGDTYEMMPSSYYTFPATPVTLKKGQTKVEFDITVHPDQFDLTQSFALPLRITSASDGILSEHFSAALFNVIVKNIYDGVYLVAEATMNRYSTAGVLENPSALGGVYPANTIEIPFATVNDVTTGISLKWKDGSGVGGVDFVRITVDPAGATPAGAPAGAKPITVFSTGLANLRNSPGLLNYYDPATRTFFLNIDWVGSSGAREFRNARLVYEKVRN